MFSGCEPTSRPGGASIQDVSSPLAWLPFAVPHLIYHLAHSGNLASTSDKITVAGSLALTAVFAVALAFSPAPTRIAGSGRMTPLVAAEDPSTK